MPHDNLIVIIIIMKRICMTALLAGLAAAGSIYNWEYVHYPKPVEDTTDQPSEVPTDQAEGKKLIDLKKWGLGLDLWLFGGGFDIDLDANFEYELPTFSTSDYYAQGLNLNMYLGGLQSAYVFLGKTNVSLFFELDVAQASLPMSAYWDTTNKQICIALKYKISSFTVKVKARIEGQECTSSMVQYLFTGVKKTCVDGVYDLDVFQIKFLGTAEDVEKNLITENGITGCWPFI
ncbi:hypothetical protein FGO68_gene14709 [Halteria grandinella]|uniref:Uncharacterized protein n=1 Tax=Halteria grandinella TaxID=5974 RepID=A0A8J8NK00_HALGN|nr:hypothetical protein FGO68_gene14709 [Halteria grandinella]